MMSGAIAAQNMDSAGDDDDTDKGRASETKPMVPSSGGKKPSAFGNDDEEDTGKGLARTLTLTNSVTMIVGCIIGSGIFVSPTGVQEAAGSVGSSLIIWVLCGLWCGLGAYIYAELGTLITKSGGDYAYIMEAFGPFIGFLRLWIESMVVRPCALTIVGLTFALYMLRPLYPDCDPPAGSKELLAAVMIMILGAVNCWSVKLATIVQDWFTYAKIVALLLVIVTGAFLVMFGQFHFCCKNFNCLFAQKVYGKFAFVMPLCVAISTVGSANGVIMTSSRLFYCGAREGHMPVLLTMINKRLRTPIPAVVFTCMVSIGYLFLSSNLYVLITASQVTAWLAITVVTIALFRLRCMYPDAPRPVKVNIIFPIIFVIGCTALVILPVIGSPIDTAIGFAVLFSAVPIYVLFIWFGKMPQCFKRFMYRFTVFWQKLFMLVDDNKYD
ncbi:amino acid permease [Ancylostoma caninum]|uniref:Amino acid permease n=1 Tax=Ancylostoma caninum TaxID=29170 RepID=A0A368GB94_ANCCA|nr:amino acid permease [Ancylostoma caninum]